ncbi:MAG: GIY-YIG nuclease family protein [Tetragenococcus sp.]|nr:GIY-YIG nuclease family protein [Tetragenococcus sp.]
MKSTIQNEDTLYAIKGYLSEKQEHVQIGKLGCFSFEKGYYVYVGSAKRNIRSRISRHIQIEKKQHWHLDYLRPYLEIQEVQTYPGAEGECQLFARLRKQNEGSIPAKGFGSSDCQCVSHLFYTATNPFVSSM